MAYDDTGGDDFPPRTVTIFGEWERLPVGGVFPEIGDDFVAQLILTEESFHGSGDQYEGGWAAAMSADINYSALTIEAEDATIKTAGGLIGGNWCLWSNGTLGESVSIPEAGTYEVVVRAYGSPLGGIWPVMELSVNGSAGETVTVDSVEYTDYVFQVDLTPGVHTIGMSFLNDAWNPGVEDRNLYLDRFTIISPPGADKPEIAGATGASLVIEAEDATIKTAGGLIGGNWCLWSNGTLGESVSIPEAGTYEVVVRAYGSPLGGIWPVMELSVNGSAGETVTVDSVEYTDYVFQVDLTPGVHTIGISFLNDAWNPGVEDRNLYLDRFTIISPPGADKPEIAGATGASLVIEAEDATIKTAGGLIGGNWCLWSNGTLGESVSIPEAGTYEVVVRAYGSPLGGIWPVMELSVNGSAGETVTVDSVEYTDYVFQVDLTPGVHTIGISFLNDAYDPGVEDRNLYLDRFTIISPPGVNKPELAP